MCEDDLRLVERCANGDEAALRRLVDCYEGLLFNIAKRVLGNGEDAEEVAMESFVKLWKSAKSFRGNCSVKSYLCGITINLCRDRLRKRDPITQPLAQEPRADATSGLRDRVYAALHLLSDEDRELLTLYYLDELDYIEIGDALGIGYDVLRTRLVRARSRLRNQLGIEDER